MIQIRRAEERGHANHGWLDARHTFSFASYHDPNHVQFRSLRVMNEDRIAPGQGFGTHPHRDMEIVTYVLSGALEHRDSMNNGQVLRAGEFQHMSAGSGITHSEFNPSGNEPVHLYQIWLLPSEQGITPSYDQIKVPDEERHNQFRLVATPDQVDGTLKINQDAAIYLANLDSDQTLQHELQPNRHAWLQVLRGSVEINGQVMSTSDGAAISDESMIRITAAQASEVMLFDLS